MILVISHNDIFYMPWAQTLGCPSRWRRHLCQIWPSTLDHPRRFAATSNIVFLMSRCPPSPPKKWSLKMVDAMASTCSVHLLRLFPALKGPPNICDSRNLLKDTISLCMQDVVWVYAECVPKVVVDEARFHHLARILALVFEPVRCLFLPALVAWSPK